LFLICFYTVKIKQINLKASLIISGRSIKYFIKKYKFVIVSLILIVILLIFIMTNIRSEVVSEIRQDSMRKEKRYEFISSLYKAQKKAWFSSVSKNLPETIVNPIAELSLYAGGTVATGGVTSRIVSDTGWHTWGLRNFFTIHRILSQLNLDGGFSDSCRENFQKVQKKAFLEVPAILSGWLGDPGNAILDFGYLGALLASLCTGWLIGWMYGCFFQSDSTIQATALSILTIPMLITPAYNFFSIDLSNSLNFIGLFLYVLFNSRRLTYKNYFLK
jgi:hypothetical protein